MIAPRTGAPEVTIAENQPEYLTLTAAAYEYSDGAYGLLTRWRLTEDERKRLLAGEDVYLMQLTFRKPMQPVRLQVGPNGYLVDADSE
jgi:hypothetical protein